MKKIIIFDFDGVLSDSVQSVYRMNRDAALEIKRNLTMEEYVACFEGHINQGLASLLNLDDTEKERFVSYKAKIFPEYYRTPDVKLFDFAKDLVIEASKLGELWIVSSTPGELITKVLDEYDLTKYFAKIIGQNRQPKHLVFREAFEAEKGAKAFFVTDTTGDIKEARKVSDTISTLAVVWGFHKPELLQSEKPSLLVREPKQIIDFIAQP